MSFRNQLEEIKKPIVKISSNLAASIPRTFSTSAVLLDVVAVPLTPTNKHDNYYPILRRYERKTNPVNLFYSG